MKTVRVIGANGFVGSAFVRHLSKEPGIEVRPVSRENRLEELGQHSAIVIDCTGNPRKYLAEEDPVQDFQLSVAERVHTLHHFPADLCLFVSSIDHKDGSNYDVHKRVMETLLQHFASDWLIVRLSGMVGPGLKKNAVYDIIHDLPIRVRPDSFYQYMLTDDAARISWELLSSGMRKEIINVVGDGLITLPEVAAIAGRELDLSLVRSDWEPWTQETDISRLKSLMPVPRTRDTIEAFVHA